MNLNRRAISVDRAVIHAVATRTGGAVVNEEATPPFFPGFRTLDIDVGGVRFASVIGGADPQLLLLHGYPETHVAWRKVAPELARHHTVIIPDLPGYGASRPHAMTPRWTKRWVGVALVALMRAFGHERFAIAGHDRGHATGDRNWLRPQPTGATAVVDHLTPLDRKHSNVN